MNSFFFIISVSWKLWYEYMMARNMQPSLPFVKLMLFLGMNLTKMDYELWCHLFQHRKCVCKWNVYFPSKIFHFEDNVSPFNIYACLLVYIVNIKLKMILDCMCINIEKHLHPDDVCATITCNKMRTEMQDVWSLNWKQLVVMVVLCRT